MKIVKHIPNTITSMNLFCGVMGVICTFKGNFEAAFCLMLAAAVCDFCDGFSARLLKAYSDVGKELDSLADMISFGLLPSIMLYSLMVSINGESIWAYIPLVIAIFSGLRLAKFIVDERQTEIFIGLATPACAMICGSFCYYVSHDTGSILYSWADTRFFIPVCSVFLSALLVCEIPMFSMKFKKNEQNKSIQRQRIVFAFAALVACILVLILKFNWSLIILVVFVSYIAINVGEFMFCRKNRE